MGRRTINQRRGLAAGQRKARYWRLRFANDVAERLAEYSDDDSHDDRYGNEYDDYEDDARQISLVHTLTDLRNRIRDVCPFNALPLAERPLDCLPSQPAGSLEARLLELVERVTSNAADAPLDEQDQASLRALETIAELHFDGDLEPLLGLALFQPFWLRSPAAWQPPRKKKLQSLTEHLLLAYPTPRFLLAAAASPWTLAELRWLVYLIVLGQGGSLRRLTELAHRRWPDQWSVIAHKFVACLAQVGETLSPAEGLMFAEVIRLGGTEIEYQRLANSLAFILDPSANDMPPHELELWRSTVTWLIRHRDELTDPVTPILTWARHVHTERQRVGERFDWRGRTVASVRRESIAYLQRLYQKRRWLTWTNHGWDWTGTIAQQDWSIRELTNSTELHEESWAMAHCVRLYDDICWRGHSAIFSLRQGGRRRVTIELRLPSKSIVQVKRACNQEPSRLELGVIEQWHATVAGLRRDAERTRGASQQPEPDRRQSRSDPDTDEDERGAEAPLELAQQRPARAEDVEQRRMDQARDRQQYRRDSK